MRHLANLHARQRQAAAAKRTALPASADPAAAAAVSSRLSIALSDDPAQQRRAFGDILHTYNTAYLLLAQWPIYRTGDLLDAVTDSQPSIESCYAVLRGGGGLSAEQQLILVTRINRLLACIAAVPKYRVTRAEVHARDWMIRNRDKNRFENPAVPWEK